MSTETVAIKIASLVLEDEPRAYEARRFVLRLTYKGAAASIWQTRADSFA